MKERRKIMTFTTKTSKGNFILSSSQINVAFKEAQRTENFKQFSNDLLVSIFETLHNKDKTGLNASSKFYFVQDMIVNGQVLNTLIYNQEQSKWINHFNISLENGFVVAELLINEANITRNLRLKINEALNANIPEASTEKDLMAELRLEELKAKELEVLENCNL